MMQRVIPQDDGELAAFGELIEWCNRRPDLRDEVLDFLDAGLPFNSCEIDPVATTADECVMIFKPSEALLSFLATFRARYGPIGSVVELDSEAVGHQAEPRLLDARISCRRGIIS